MIFSCRLLVRFVCLQGQLTVANGVLFGATSSGNDSSIASLFALNATDGTVLTAVTLDNVLVQNGPSIVNNILYQGAGDCIFHCQLSLLQSDTACMHACMMCISALCCCELLPV